MKLDPEAPCCCIAFQVAASAAFALLVFVLATRPRHPQVSFSVGKVQRFALGDGLDGSGVETSFLNCNSSVDMVIDNYSKVFTLRVGPPQLQMSFGRFVLAISQASTSIDLVLSLVSIHNRPAAELSCSVCGLALLCWCCRETASVHAALGR